MKNTILIVLFALFSNIFLSQEISLSEENQYFSIGSKNAIVVNIPYGNKDIVESQLRKELKSWDGKYDTKKDEFISAQGIVKFMGIKPFDAYAKIISGSEKDNEIKVAFAIDLGGAFLSSNDHPDQFKAMSSRIKDFARETSLVCIDEELKQQNKTLSTLEKNQRSLEKDKADLTEDIENYKQKIADAEKKIEKNLQDQGRTKEDIEHQKEKISEIDKRKKSIK